MVEVVIPERGDIPGDPMGWKALRSQRRGKQPALGILVIEDRQDWLHALRGGGHPDSRSENERRRRQGNTVLNELSAIVHVPPTACLKFVWRPIVEYTRKRVKYNR